MRKSIRKNSMRNSINNSIYCLNSRKRILAGKKAVSAYIAWVLILGLGVAISAVVYNWAVGFAGNRAKDLEKRVYDRSECELVGLSIASVCQHPQTLNINITNNNQLGITGFIVRMYSIYSDVQPETREINASIPPNAARAVTVTKQGSKSRVEIIPFVSKPGNVIVCREKVTAAESVPLC